MPSGPGLELRPVLQGRLRLRRGPTAGLLLSKCGVNVDAQSRYMADFDEVSAACATKGCNGNCPAAAGPCCRDGICGLGAQCLGPVPAEDATAESGADADGEGRSADAGGE